VPSNFEDFGINFDSKNEDSLILTLTKIRNIIRDINRDYNKTFKPKKEFKLPTRGKTLDTSISKQESVNSRALARTEQEIAKYALYRRDALQSSAYQLARSAKIELDTIQNVIDGRTKNNTLLNNEQLLQQKINSDSDLALKKSEQKIQYDKEHISALAQQKKDRAEISQLINQEAGLTKSQVDNARERLNYTTEHKSEIVQVMAAQAEINRQIREEAGLTKSQVDREREHLQYTQDHKKELIEIRKQQAKVNKEIGIGAGTQKTGLQKLTDTFKRLGIYRLGRLIYSEIGKGLSEGVSSFAKFDKQSNQTMSSITSSITIITSSIGSIIAPMLEVVEPIIKEIAVGIADVANAISKASASMKGLSTYTKINTDYMKEYGAETNKSLLSFDKFETLSGTDTDSAYETANVDEATSDLDGFASSFMTLISQLKDLLLEVWDIIKSILSALAPVLDVVMSIVSLVLDLILNSGILDFINNIIDPIVYIVKEVMIIIKAIIPLLQPILDVVANIVYLLLELIENSGILTYIKDIVDIVVALIVPALEGISTIIKFIIAILKGDFKSAFKELGNYFKSFAKEIGNFFIAIINVAIMVIEDVVNGIIKMLNLIWLPWKALLNLVGVNVGDIPKISIPRISYLAEGGMVDKGSLFVAGEAGAELVTQMPSGQTGVTNVKQLKQAFVEALYECSDLFEREDGDVVLKVDGAEIARSKRFKSEINRTNPSLNLI
jgi:hypothetical protein